MKIGDELRISEKQYHKQDGLKVTEGKIIAIYPWSITILNKSGFKETFNIGDLISKRQKKEINENGNWEQIKFKQEGGKIVLCKIVKSNNRICNGNS